MPDVFDRIELVMVEEDCELLAPNEGVRFTLMFGSILAFCTIQWCRITPSRFSLSFGFFFNSLLMRSAASADTLGGNLYSTLRIFWYVPSWDGVSNGGLPTRSS